MLWSKFCISIRMLWSKFYYRGKTGFAHFKFFKTFEHQAARKARAAEIKWRWRLCPPQTAMFQGNRMPRKYFFLIKIEDFAAFHYDICYVVNFSRLEEICSLMCMCRTWVLWHICDEKIRQQVVPCKECLYRSLAISRHLGLFPQTSKNYICYPWRYWVRDNKTIYDTVQCLYNQAKYRNLTVNCLAGTAIINLYKRRWRLIASSDVTCKRPIRPSTKIAPDWSIPIYPSNVIATKPAMKIPYNLSLTCCLK